MHTTLMDLASQVFLFVATFKRKAKRGTALSGDELREEITQIFRELDQQAQVEAGLVDSWEMAKKPLIYLVDEIMISTEWEYRGWWADNDLETALLGHPQKMRGILFYDELEEVKKTFDIAEKVQRQDYKYLVDLLAVFYCCLRFGFEGKFVGQPQELEREAQQVFSKLPAYKQTRTREFFEDAYKHTIEIQPNYENVMRLATMVAIVVGMAVLFVGFRELLWNELLDDLSGAVDEVGEFFKGQA